MQQKGLRKLRGEISEQSRANRRKCGNSQVAVKTSGGEPLCHQQKTSEVSISERRSLPNFAIYVQTSFWTEKHYVQD